MTSELLPRIRTWFAEHEEDGDFPCSPCHPYEVLRPGADDGRIIFTTKPRSVALAIKANSGCANLGMMGRFGLPDETDLDWIVSAGSRRQLLFLGDMDPVDLLVFAALRAMLPAGNVSYLGISDTYLAKLDVFIPKSYFIRCTSSEIASLALLKEVFPKLREFIGPKCLQHLEQGMKLEVEAIVSAFGESGPLLGPALDAPSDRAS